MSEKPFIDQINDHVMGMQRAQKTLQQMAGSSGSAATEFEIDRLRQQLSEARGKIEELTEKWRLSRTACASACRRANELRSEVNGLKSAINADEIVLILSENEGASHGYLAVQICEKIEADAHEKHLSSEYMRTRPIKEITDA